MRSPLQEMEAGLVAELDELWPRIVSRRATNRWGVGQYRPIVRVVDDCLAAARNAGNLSTDQ